VQYNRNDISGVVGQRSNFMKHCANIGAMTLNSPIFPNNRPIQYWNNVAPTLHASTVE